MFKIIEKKDLNNACSCITIEATLIAKEAKPGQFVVILIEEKGERIPLKLVDWDKEKGDITVIFSKVDHSSNRLTKLEAGDTLKQVIGPLGKPTEINKLEEIYCIADGCSIAEIYPIVRAFKKAGSRVISIIEAQNKDLLLFENKLREVSDELFIALNNSPNAASHSASDILKDLFNVIEKSTHTHYPNLVYCYGSMDLMRRISEFTAGYQVNTIISLDPIMVDTEGLCGGCRCKNEGNAIFNYSTGPDFAAENINFDELKTQLGFIKNYRNKDLKDK